MVNDSLDFISRHNRCPKHADALIRLDDDSVLCDNNSSSSRDYACPIIHCPTCVSHLVSINRAITIYHYHGVYQSSIETLEKQRVSTFTVNYPVSTKASVGIGVYIETFGTIITHLKELLIASDGIKERIKRHFYLDHCLVFIDEPLRDLASYSIAIFIIRSSDLLNSNVSIHQNTISNSVHTISGTTFKLIAVYCIDSFIIGISISLNCAIY